MSYFALNNRLEQMFKDQDVKERILESARELFIKNGYNGTSIRDIANVSDTNVAMVNYYFRSKYNLFQIIFEEYLEMITNRVFKILDSDLPFFELIETWIDNYFEILTEYPQIPIFILNEVSNHPAQLTNRIKNMAPYDILLKVSHRIKEEEKKGTILETPPVDFLLNVLSLCVFPFIFGKLAIQVSEKSIEDYYKFLKDHKAYVKEFVVHALRPS